VTAGGAGRVDLFTPIHEGLRALLSALGAAAARLDLERTEEVDALVARVERGLGCLDQHLAHEERHIMPVLRVVAPAVEAELAGEHHRLDALGSEVADAAYLLASATQDERPPLAARLCRLLDALTCGHLAHMDREEREANQALWESLDDPELLLIRQQVSGAEPIAADG
jgi:Hemerythrin HHE cation binding domain